MKTLQLSTSLDHIDNQELARLAGLWRAQVSSGHAEALSIANSFCAEQRRRADKQSSLTPNTRTALIDPAWWKFWQ